MEQVYVLDLLFVCFCYKEPTTHTPNACKYMENNWKDMHQLVIVKCSKSLPTLVSTRSSALESSCSGLAVSSIKLQGA